MKHDSLHSRQPGRPAEAGFALILAILALVLLTFLGLTLATTTSTELQIAANYKWSEQAFYNAEAGIEVGKAILRDIPNWANVLPAARAGTWDGTTAPTVMGGGGVAPQTRNDAWGNASRNFESWGCDLDNNGMGYGVVLDDGGANAPYQYKTSHAALAIPGAFTLWVRRPTFTQTSGTLGDYGGAATGVDDTNLILVAEGVAPFGAGLQATSRAVRVIEVALSKTTPTASAPCGSRSGQAGGGPEGSNFAACDSVTGAGLTGALTGYVAGTPTETAAK